MNVDSNSRFRKKIRKIRDGSFGREILSDRPDACSTTTVRWKEILRHHTRALMEMPYFAFHPSFLSF